MAGPSGAVVISLKQDGCGWSCAATFAAGGEVGFRRNPPPAPATELAPDLPLRILGFLLQSSFLSLFVFLVWGPRRRMARVRANISMAGPFPSACV